MAPLPPPEAEVARILAAEPAIQRAILFGSRARGTAGRASDIDILLQAPGDDAGLLKRLWDAFDNRDSLLRVDVHFWDEVPEALREEAVREGIVLVGPPL